ncbi:unnamed protein product [Cylicocyclus nassatus]|uniref:SCP domain-containing protein n=1 Tax=Cylicocyclus nassatus TaxID=53992 RepID=A0AA36HBI8_CYLNA|nr:unnamed protein product [Cylicocyclus nassatus]
MFMYAQPDYGWQQHTSWHPLLHLSQKMSITMSIALFMGKFYILHVDKDEKGSADTRNVNTTMTGPPSDDLLRNIFLTTHNNYRARIARGETERNGRSGENAPPASLMYTMRYSLAAESYARRHVERCDKRQYYEWELPGHRENVHVLERNDINSERAALLAMNDWWSELNRYGVPSNMIYTADMHTRSSAPVRSFTKMAWWKNTELGCAVKNCTTFFFTSCIYGPGGNDVGRPIYNVGAVCSGCSSGCQHGLCPLPHS